MNSQIDLAESKESKRDSVSRDDRAPTDSTPIAKTVAVARNANPKANKALRSDARKPTLAAKQDNPAESIHEQEKRPSKVESFINKAGRILKKPFKL